jgi:hypothetical protein
VPQRPAEVIQLIRRSSGVDVVVEGRCCRREGVHHPPETQYSQSAKTEGSFAPHRRIGEERAQKSGLAKIVSHQLKPETGMPKFEHDSHWRTSGDRTYLLADSLLTGNFTGKLAISRILGIVALTNRPCRIDFSRNSLAIYQGKHFGDQGILWRNQDKTIYLNHAGAGLVPRHERSP